MFYANNEQVKGIFLNGRNYNYLAYGFGKIIPEDRNAVQANLNLAYKYLNQYRIEFGTVKDGYDNALVSPRFDNPDSNGIFHTPFTYYYNGNIISTKEVPVLITDGNYALRNALVYNDMNINGAINYFATNTDFQGHNVNVFPEKDNYQSAPLLNYEMLNNCSNFDLNIETRFSKATYPTLYNCNNFSGNFRYVGNQDYNYPGFRGFLEDCKDGVFNINCTNMHGGGSDANVTNYYNFSGIQGCNNIRLNITGSSWQVWPHDHSFSSNCNINTYNVISGFGYMNDCNFNVELPKDSKPEMSQSFEFLNNAINCNYNLQALDSNLFNYRSGVGHSLFFENLNNCNLNLLVNNTVSFDHSFGNSLHNCNIVFDNIKADLSTFTGWDYLYNCNITGNVEAASSNQEFVGQSDGINVNINFAKSSRVLPMWRCNNVKGNIVAGGDTRVTYGNYMNLNISRGSLYLTWIKHSIFNFNGTNIYANNLNNCKFKIYNCNDFAANYISNSYIRADSTLFSILRANDTEIQSEGSNVSILGADNCYNLTLSGLTFKTPTSSACLFENIYNSNLKFGTVNPYYRLWRATNCHFDGFPRELTYVKNCVFRPFNMSYVAKSTSGVGTWNNLWPHRTLAGIRSINTIENCRVEASGWGLDGSITFNNVNDMQTSVGTYYNGTVTANLPIYNMEIKLNVDCNTLNLGIFQAEPPHGFQNATISANTIYATGHGAGGDTYVHLNSDVKLYCENFCNVPFYVSGVRDYNNNKLQVVALINNYQHSNSTACQVLGGLTRIGRLNFQGGAPANLTIGASAFVFINNALLGSTEVYQNSVLFLGSNVHQVNGITVESGGLVVNKENWGSHASEIWSRIDRGHLAWNVWDSGPWGSQSLFDYCINV